jgi:hypothetical protein
MWRAVLALSLLVILVSRPVGGIAGGAPGSDPPGAQGLHPVDAEFRSVWAEFRLAEGGRPYLILDVAERRIDLRLKGALVWTCPIEFEAPDSLVTFETKPYLVGERNPPVEVLTGKHLYTYRDVFADSMLAVVSRVSRARADNLQRREPGHFEMRFSHGFVIDVHTGAEDVHGSWTANALAAVRDALLAPLTGPELKIRMEPRDALTLYRAAMPPLPMVVRAEGSRMGTVARSGIR